jgi:type I restriction enzyme S subunit
MKTNWQIKKIDEVCILRPQKSEIKLTKDDLVSFVPMEDMKVFSKDLNLHTDRKLSEVRDGYTYFANEDVLLAKITPCFENGKLGIARGLKNGIGFGSSEYFVFRSKGEILPDYLYYILSSDNFRDQGIKLMSGAVGHKRVPKEYVENFKISFPPIPEQKRIVKILDEAFEKLEKAKENTEKNLQNSKELFESYLNDIFSNPKKDWEEKTLGDICVFENGDRGKNYPAKSKLHLEGIPFVTAGNIDNHDIVLGGKNYLSEKQYDLLSRGKFSRGDILFCLRGSLGKFAVVNSIEYGAIASSLMIVKFNKEVISNFFYYYF